MTQAFKVSGIVIIENPNKKRLNWPLGKAVELIHGRDGKICTLKLRCSNSEIIHPIQRVFPLEIQSAEMAESHDVPLDAEALKIPSANVDILESAMIPIDAPPNMPKVSRYGRTFSMALLFLSLSRLLRGCCVPTLGLINYQAMCLPLPCMRGKTAPLLPRGVAAVAEWLRYQIVAGLVTSSSPVPLKTSHIGERCMLNLSTAQISSCWCGS
ncbi:hypothetical protein TNCV_21951 [Trichonephila clavipes]|nr:hypothetical protein TNCV_21951 [Trichonephila clavipes]